MKLIRLPKGTISAEKLKNKTFTECEVFGVSKDFYKKLVKDGTIVVSGNEKTAKKKVVEKSNPKKKVALKD